MWVSDFKYLVSHFLALQIQIVTIQRRLFMVVMYQIKYA